MYDHVSYGTFLNLKPFYIRAATTKDFEVCCCKLHLEARWTVDAIVKLCAKQNTKLQFENYEGFFLFLYGDCTCHDENANVYVNWACTPDKTSMCGDIRKRWENLITYLNTYSNDLTIDILCFEKTTIITKKGKEYEKLKAVIKCADMA